MANPKVVAVRVPKVSIEAVRNGFRLTVGKSDSSVTVSNDQYFVYNGDSGLTWTTLTCAGGSEPTTAKKTKPAPRYVTPSGEYVFPDFASLTAWLRKNITHGNGVEA